MQTDTEKFYTMVQENILAKHGKTFDWSLKAKMMGKKAIEAARVFIQETGLTDIMTPEGFLIEREAMLRDLFPTSELMPGVYAFRFSISEFQFSPPPLFSIFNYLSLIAS